MSVDNNKLAELEIQWWQNHHRRLPEAAIAAMAEQFKLLYGLTEEDAVKAAKLKVSAGQQHDYAEKCEDLGELYTAKQFWNNAKEILEMHFEIIQRGRKQ